MLPTLLVAEDGHDIRALPPNINCYVQVKSSAPEEELAPRDVMPPMVVEEAVTLHTADGVRLSARWLRTPAASATAVIVHGFSAHQLDAGVRRMAAALLSSGFDVLLYDARGHGDSGGKSTLGSAEHLDVAAAAEVAAADGPTPLLLVGVSMGVVAVIRHLAGSNPVPVAGAVLVSGPARWRMRLSPIGAATAFIARTALGRWVAARKLHVRVAPRWRLGEAPETSLRRVRVPVAVVHGEADRLLAHSNGRRLQRSAGGPVSLEVVASMGHGLDELCVEAVLRGVEWLRSLEAPPQAAGSRS